MLRGLAIVVVWLLSTSCVLAQTVDFTPPKAIDDPQLEVSIRELAARSIQLLNNTDRDARLNDLALLQLAMARYPEAADTFGALRELRSENSGSPPIRAVALEIYANAKVTETTTRLSFEEAFRKAFNELLPELDDRTAYDLEWLLGTYPGVFQNILTQTLQRYPAAVKIPVQESVGVVSDFLWWRMFTSIAPLVAPLVDAEQKSRYLIQILPNAIVVRAKSAAPGPTLFNFTIYTYPGDVAAAIESAAHGYASVTGFTRGKFHGSGPIEPYEHDGDDARAMIDWITKQPWSDGRVGMYAGSYSGFAQWAVAKNPPPALKAIMASASAAPGIAEPMEGNIFQTYLYRWVPYTTNGPMQDEDAYNDMDHWNGLDKTWYRSGRPYRDMDKIDGTPNPIYRRWLEHPSYDKYWQRMIPYQQEFARINIPVLQTTGYFDGGQIGTLWYFRQHYDYNPTANHTLLIGPYGHLSAQHSSGAEIQGYTLDPVARLNMHDVRYAWFDHILKFAPRPAILSDRINYQVMGSNEWRHARTIAAMSTGSLTLHLAPRQLLETSPPPSTFTEMTIDFADRSDVDWVPSSDIVSPSLDAHNALAFATEPFKKDAEVSGQIGGTLDFIVNKKDFDFSMRWYELTADGKYVRLTIPYLQRASYLRDRSKRQLLTPGKHQQLDFVNAGLVGRKLKAGSRIVLLLGINKQRDAQVNYGTGKDVSAESIADAKQPLRVQWFATSVVKLPVTQ
jgi:putative CocE/NonD family hydrolase